MVSINHYINIYSTSMKYRLAPFSVVVVNSSRVSTGMMLVNPRPFNLTLHDLVPTTRTSTQAYTHTRALDTHGRLCPQSRSHHSLSLSQLMPACRSRHEMLTFTKASRTVGNKLTRMYLSRSMQNTILVTVKKIKISKIKFVNFRLFSNFIQKRGIFRKK